MKKGIVTLTFAVALLSGAAICVWLTPEELTVTSTLASYPMYDSVEDLEMETDAIVIATFHGERKTVDVPIAHGVSKPLTYSDVKVQKVLQGDVKEGNTLQIAEEAVVQKGRYISTEGYKWMDEEGKYMLFLKKMSASDRYRIVGAYQGKFNLNITQPKSFPHTQEGLNKAIQDTQVEYMGDEHNTEHFLNLKEDAIKKYQP